MFLLQSPDFPIICGVNGEGIIVRFSSFWSIREKIREKNCEREIRRLYCDRPSMSPEHREFRAWVWHVSSWLGQWEIRGNDKLGERKSQLIVAFRVQPGKRRSAAQL